MNFITFKQLFFVSALIFFNNVSGQIPPLTENSKISIITCGKGAEVYSIFGHTGIRVTDSISKIDVVYNFGAFDFSTPNFYGKFVMGNLQYFAVVEYYSSFINQYKFEKRSVLEQELDIPLELKQKLFDKLNNTTLNAEERFYTYKFIDKNCTTMVVDLLNNTLGGKIIVNKGKVEHTYREVLFPLFNGFFYAQLGTSICFGRKVDAMATKVFLPNQLKNSLQKTYYRGKPLIKKTETILKYSEKRRFSWYDNIFAFAFIFIVIMALNNKILDLVYLTSSALFGIYLIIAWIFSQHTELYYNYNILLFNPFLIFVVFYSIMKTKNQKSTIFKWAFTLFIILILYTIFMLNKAHLFATLPIILTTYVVLIRTIWRNSEKWFDSILQIFGYFKKATSVFNPF